MFPERDRLRAARHEHAVRSSADGVLGDAANAGIGITTEARRKKTIGHCKFVICNWSFQKWPNDKFAITNDKFFFSVISVPSVVNCFFAPRLLARGQQRTGDFGSDLRSRDRSRRQIRPGCRTLRCRGESALLIARLCASARRTAATLVRASTVERAPRPACARCRRYHQ